MVASVMKHQENVR